HTMANFSVEWLSQSFYNTSTDQVDIEEDTTHDRTRSRMPCVVVPRAPSTYNQVVGDDSDGEYALHRRMRTKFTSDQICRLERTFNKHKYLGTTQRRKIAEKMKLSETQVKTWFQNRRMKLKREVQDLRPELFSPPRVPLQQMIHGKPIHPMMLAPCYY
uniref:Homeobox domain-containing protein n=1 Tax=Oncorhynchus mykiss TaxID=8022 RepID=A0A8C7VTZ0_ONCMY